MEQLIMAIAVPLAKQYGMNKALEIAYERLGIAAPEQSAVDVLTGGGINQAFSPGNLSNMFKRGALRLGANTLIKGMGSGFLPFAGITGLALLGNKYRKQLTGYDTQAAYEAARQERIANKRLDRITDRMLDGKDYANYEEALLDSGAGAVKIDDTVYSGADYQGDNDGGSTSNTNKTSKSSSRPSRQTSGPGGLHSNYRRGGIASL